MYGDQTGKCLEGVTFQVLGRMDRVVCRNFVKYVQTARQQNILIRYSYANFVLSPLRVKLGSRAQGPFLVELCSR